MHPSPKVWTCGARLTEVLADKVLAGFPLAGGTAHDLSGWTILVPTRRAAQALEQRLFRNARSSALLLPTVRPIGDSDEDLLEEVFPREGVKDAISATGQLFLLLQLIDTWAKDNPALPLAESVQASESQALGLAQSLAQFFNQMETEEISASLLAAFTPLDLAEHRQTIMSLLDLVEQQMPRKLDALGLVSAASRRNSLIRLEAERIRLHHTGPIIAAGSTGTNPATRDLLKTIALHPQGAVVLPGLDLELDETAWASVSPNHPQYGLKTLLAHLGTDRSLVGRLGDASARDDLVREIMRPAETTDQWAGTARLDAATIMTAREGLTLVEAPDRHLEARSIAVMLRQQLETPLARAALVTPDRDLAQMVTAEMQRWSAAIDDSGGEPLIRFGRALLCKLVIDCVDEDFAPAALVAVLAHPAVTLGFGRDSAQLLAQRFEVALLRQDLPPKGPASFSTTLANMRREAGRDAHAHPMLRAMDDAEWDDLARFTERFAAALQHVAAAGEGSFASHLEKLLACLEGLSPADDSDGATRAFDSVMDSLRQEAPHHPVGPFARALPSIAWALRQETLRPQRREGTRLSIYGLAEARMIEADVVVLGGLNETVWPAAVDPGPWVNRSMRGSLGLSMPERDIGVTAHDLAQGLLHPRVVLTWSKRAGTAPLMPSRWILRLRALLGQGGMKQEDQLDQTWPRLARALDSGATPAAVLMPKPAPPVALRPTRFSVTEIETLIRDPYAVYARRILALDPLEPLGGTADPALRGTLVHDALHRYAAGGTFALADLLAAGEACFAPYMDHPDVRHFWWPRFRRMAQAFVAEDEALRSDVAAVLTERKGSTVFQAGGAEHTLRARADRIDVTQQGTVRLIDYKTGATPSGKQVSSGLNPQLTLEAAIVNRGGFGEGLPMEVDDLIYIRVGGGRTPAEFMSLKGLVRDPVDITATMQKHFGGLLNLLALYQNAGQAYPPRAVMHKDSDVSDYDHLSRFDEWSRGGE